MARNGTRASEGGLRERLAQEAARLMIEHGIADYRMAKRKAVARLAVRRTGTLPSNAQIEACLAERQRIFEPQAHRDRVELLRELAARVMRSFSLFEPRLVGPVLAGTATINSVIELHLFAGSPESVAGVLQRGGVNFSDCQRRLRFSGGHSESIPGFSFFREGQRILTLIFPENGLREAPLSPVDRRPMERAALSKVSALLRGGS